MTLPLAQRKTPSVRVDPLKSGAQLVDLRQLSARELEPLLLEESVDWRLELDWDFSKTAGLVRELTAARKLCGVAVLDRGQVVGYGYTGLADRKAVIADIYVRRPWRGGNAEESIFRLLLDALIGTKGVCRIESQLMLAETGWAKVLRRERRVRLHERCLMTLDANAPLPPGGASTNQRFRIEPWGDRYHDAAAVVLSLAYGGHVDSQINDEYRTFADARRLLHNIVQFPGSAPFFRPASYVAFDTPTGEAAGILLSSFASHDVGHITEICVALNARGAGLGYELLRQSAATLRDAGAKRISLTVTLANREAIRLYTRCGFREMRRFYAYVWEKPS